LLFASMARDGVEIMLLRIEGYKKPDLPPLRPAGLWDAYIRTEGIRELYKSLRDKISIKTPLVSGQMATLNLGYKTPRATRWCLVSYWIETGQRDQADGM
jgi:hypothetical protein